MIFLEIKWLGFRYNKSHLQFKIHVKSVLDRVAPFNIAHPSNAQWKSLRKALNGFDKNLNSVKAFTLQSPMVPILKELRDYAMISFDRFDLLYDAGDGFKYQDLRRI